MNIGQKINRVAKEAIEKKWDDLTGDARQEIVLIGMEMNQSELIHRFNACLLNDEEMALGANVWKSFDNPFLEWNEMTQNN